MATATTRLDPRHRRRRNHAGDPRGAADARGLPRPPRLARAEEGLELARTLPFDAAIVDVMMPGMDGIAALEELKKIDEELPVAHDHRVRVGRDARSRR